MLAALFNGNKDIVLCDYSLRTLEKNELLIKVACCGVCGTDRHIYEGNAPSSIPIILGHEYSGIIVEKGDSDSKFNIGNKVAINPNIYCGHCDYCKRGKVNFCENHKALGVTLNGGFAEYSIVPEAQAYRLPDDFDLSLASFAEPLSCCLRGIEHADIKPGNTVVIIGGGSIGLLMVQLVRNAGAAKIILIEPDLIKRNLGIELGADYAFSPTNDNLSEVIKDSTQSQTDVIIECVGKSETVELAVKLACKGSKIVIFGLAPLDHNVTLNLQYLFKNELIILNSYLNPFTFRPAINLLIAGKINVQKLITNQIVLKNINKIFHNSIDSSIKQQIINN
jgi:2-desacetyl-2-hydroxyethyl bacteriochlorophyllide A dehydrogenase